MDWDKSLSNAVSKFLIFFFLKNLTNWSISFEDDIPQLNMIGFLALIISLMRNRLLTSPDAIFIAGIFNFKSILRALIEKGELKKTNFFFFLHNY